MNQRLIATATHEFRAWFVGLAVAVERGVDKNGQLADTCQIVRG